MFTVPEKCDGAICCGQGSGRDPYGSALMAAGDLAHDNPFGFSTKYEDAESGFVYYGYRYYAPGVGRWVSRDPAGEWAGVHLYLAVLNDPLSTVDPDGLAPERDGCIIRDNEYVNCVGWGLGDGTDMQPAPGATWRRIIEQLGYGPVYSKNERGEPMQSADDCDRICGPCKEAVVMYVPKYHKDKDPLYDEWDGKAPPGEGFGKEKDSYDVHFVTRGSHCNRPKPNQPWEHILQREEAPPPGGKPCMARWGVFDPRTFEPMHPDEWVKDRYRVDDILRMYCICREKEWGRTR